MHLQLRLILIYNRIMYICVCNAVRESEIVSSVQEGNEDLDSVSVNLGVGKCCGSCIHVATAIIERTRTENKTSSSSDLYRQLST